MKRDAILEQELLEHLAAHPRKKYLCYQIANAIGRTSVECKGTLERMTEQNLIWRELDDGGSPRYQAATGERVTAPQRLSFSKKEYKQGREWDTVSQRLAEFREIGSKHI
jgi:hypothetical protein